MEPLSTLPVPGPAGCEKGEKRRQDYTRLGEMRVTQEHSTSVPGCSCSGEFGLPGTARSHLGEPPSSPDTVCFAACQFISILLLSAQHSNGTWLSLNNTHAGGTGTGASGKAQPWLLTISRPLLCLQLGAAGLPVQGYGSPFCRCSPWSTPTLACSTAFPEVVLGCQDSL